MESIFSDRIHDVPRSFIREILKVTLDPEVISFAGGLPNRALFPLKKIQLATEQVFNETGSSCLQYSNSEGLLELREYISEHYHKTQNLSIDPTSILITNGSQQALDLIAKITLNDGDQVIIEEPGYLGAIQALSLYRPRYCPVPVTDQGMDIFVLEEQFKNHVPKLMYTVPNFQNPSGITYPRENRKKIAELISGKEVLLVEDDPYGALRFKGEAAPSFYHFVPKQTILLGSFSKMVVPGLRLGWVVAPGEIFEKLLIAKQAADLHTSNFTQHIMNRFLRDNDLDDHIDTINKAYGSQCSAMLAAIDHFFPEIVSCTRPDGGMFLWGSLPDHLSSLELFDHAVESGVIFVPGEPFYTSEEKTSSFRLNFSCVDENLIHDGIERLAISIKRMLR